MSITQLLAFANKIQQLHTIERPAGKSSFCCTCLPLMATISGWSAVGRNTRACRRLRPPRLESFPCEPSAELKPSMATCLYSRQLRQIYTDKEPFSKYNKYNEGQLFWLITTWKKSFAYCLIGLLNQDWICSFLIATPHLTQRIASLMQQKRTSLLLLSLS